MPSTDNDTFAKTLEFEALESRFGYARARAVARPEYLNGLGIAHADFALALAANTDERSSVSVISSINYIAPCPAGAVVTAEARAVFADQKTALFDVRIFGDSPESPYAVFQARAVFKRPR